MDSINKLEHLVDIYLTEKVTKDEYPMVWSYCQVDSEKYRLKNHIIKQMIKMVNPNIETVIGQIESELYNFQE